MWKDIILDEIRSIPDEDKTKAFLETVRQAGSSFPQQYRSQLLALLDVLEVKVFSTIPKVYRLQKNVVSV